MDDKLTFQKGQVWTYNTRLLEKESIFIIFKIENLNNITIAHVKVEGLNMLSSDGSGTIGTSISHIPISIEYLKRSAIELKKNIPVHINQGYKYWRILYSKNQAGVWALELKDIISSIETSF